MAAASKTGGHLDDFHIAPLEPSGTGAEMAMNLARLSAGAAMVGVLGSAVSPGLAAMACQPYISGRHIAPAVSAPANITMRFFGRTYVHAVVAVDA